MLTKNSIVIVLVYFAVLLMTGCKISAPPPNADEMTPLIATQTSTPTTIPTAALATKSTPLPLPTHGSTDITNQPTPPLPLTDQRNFPFTDFFFEDQSSVSCILPCWRGLEIGESGPLEVQGMFNTVFDFDHSKNFFIDISDNSTLAIVHADSTLVPDLYSVYHLWSAGESFDQFFYAIAGFERATNKLALLGFHWETMDSSKFKVMMSPQDVIKRLGKPSEIMTGVLGLVGSRGIVTFTLIYNQGIVFEFIYEGPMKNMWADEAQTSMEQATVQLCLGNTETTNGIYDVSGNIYIVSPFAEDLGDLTPIQNATVGIRIAQKKLVHVHEIFDIGVDEITRLALEESNPCFISKNLLEQ